MSNFVSDDDQVEEFDIQKRVLKSRNTNNESFFLPIRLNNRTEQKP